MEAPEDLAEHRAGQQPAVGGLRGGQDVEDGRRGNRAERQQPAHPDDQRHERDKPQGDHLTIIDVALRLEGETSPRLFAPFWLCDLCDEPSARAANYRPNAT